VIKGNNYKIILGGSARGLFVKNAKSLMGRALVYATHAWHLACET